MPKNKYFYVFILNLIVLTGCWDVVNIEDRGFIIGSAIDLIEADEGKQPVFLITNQIAVPAGMDPSSQQSGQGNKAFLNYSSIGTSIYKMEEEVTTISSKVPYYEHLEVLIISEEIAKKDKLLTKIIDTYIRNVNLRRGIKVVVSKGEAKKLLEFQSPNSRLPAKHIVELLERSSQQVGLLKPHVSGDIEEFNLRKNSFVLPYLEVDDYLSYKSGAVFLGPLEKMVGTLNADEMHAIGMVKGDTTTNTAEFLYKGESFALKVLQLESNITVDPSRLEEIEATIHIEVEGVIKESFAEGDFTKSSEIEAIRAAISQDIKDIVKSLIQKVQEELGADVLGIWRVLETKHYNVWKQIKDDWETGEKYFENVRFNIDVNAEVYSTGTVER